MTATLTPTGSLRALMDEWQRLQETVHSDLRVYRWQPVEHPDLPAIWNWLGPSPFEIRDLSRWRDSVTIFTRIGVQPGDDDMDTLSEYIDAFRDVVDDALYNQNPVGSAATWAERQNMQMVTIEFNQIPVLTAEFTMLFRLDRRITPNS